ncbi:hypothetical protein SNE40_014568 [Patella caerulea]|uniref:EF-hand domain-containing protein n=1 Tax=Patella caerulea TaxID=87958 RepID=A0AAN8JIA3_PATCE
MKRRVLLLTFVLGFTINFGYSKEISREKTHDVKETETRFQLIRENGGIDGFEDVRSIGAVDISDSDISDIFNDRKLNQGNSNDESFDIINDVQPKDGLKLLDDFQSEKYESLKSVIDTIVIDDDRDENKINDQSETPSDVVPADEFVFEPIRMPTHFKSYDSNNDGFIEIKELVDVTGASENVQAAFEASDFDSKYLSDNRNN